jgi:FkbM family methyltransferase
MDNYGRIYMDGKYVDVVAPNMFQLYAILNYMVIYDAGRYNLIAQACNPDKPGIIADVGGSIGQSVLLYSRLFPQRGFVCVEPSEYNLKYLRKNSIGYDVDIIKAAFGDRVEKRTLSFPDHEQKRRPDIESNSGLFSLGGRGKVVEELTTTTMDEALWNKTLFYLDLDVEGFELEVIRGGKRIIERDRPYILIEIDEENQLMCGHKTEEIFDEMKSIGYLKSLESTRDCLFIPKELKDDFRSRIGQQSQGSSGFSLRDDPKS